MNQEILLIVVGIFSIGAAIHVLLLKRSLIRDGGRTTATVLRTERQRMRTGSKSGWTYVPILEYTVDGHTYEKEHHGNIRPKYKDGETLEVMYRKDNPEKVMVVGDKLQYVGSAVFILAGVTMLGIGLARLLA